MRKSAKKKEIISVSVQTNAVYFVHFFQMEIYLVSRSAGFCNRILKMPYMCCLQAFMWRGLALKEKATHSECQELVIWKTHMANKLNHKA